MKISNTSFHKPVLLDEAIDFLNIKNHGIYVDCTFGAGGYSKAILEKNSNCIVYGVDRDSNVINFANEIKLKFGENRFKFLNNNFGKLDELLTNQNVDKVNGIVVDLGVSSMQLDNGERGFSFLKDGPLDMRMDNSQGLTAKDFINSVSEEELADIIYKFGEERHSRKIAKKILEFRKSSQLNSTFDLANIVRSVIPKNRNCKIDPATKTFQAIRIYLNEELLELEKLLYSSIKKLSPDGILVIVSFHSLEDSIVKNFIKNNSAKKIAISKYSQNKKCSEDEEYFVNLTRKVVTPSDKEIKENIRSRSAKLRAARRTNKVYSEEIS